MVLGIGIGMFYSWRLGLVALAFTPVLLIFFYFEIKLTEQTNMGNSKALEKSTKVAVEAVSNIRTVVSLGRERMFHQQYLDLLEPSVASAKRVTHIRGLVYGIARSLFFYAFAACMAYGGQLVVSQDMSIAAVFVYA